MADLSFSVFREYAMIVDYTSEQIVQATFEVLKQEAGYRLMDMLTKVTNAPMSVLVRVDAGPHGLTMYVVLQPVAVTCGDVLFIERKE